MNSDSSNCYRDRAAVSNMDSWHTKARGDPLPLRQRSHWQPPTSSSQSNTSSIDSPLYSQSSTIFNSTSTTPPNTTIYGGILPEEEPATHKILTRVAGQARGVGDYVFSDILGNRLCKLENYSTATRADLQIPVSLYI